ncbi:hypothetical protein PP182_19405 [Maribacter sp. PR1]|uniref:Lipoprotein n=1 Tax=Maribacter cobaltidurans TaxID=1178778 RepID=A0ABU7IZJ0_9FLAO|nr:MULTISPECIES: hypothetical protein [Maribacter]MDC6390861.1 hypothetical protein [Maribacter sp. PR1]MEE1978253.1 hypothetical protein [Maribacter cobaltidurans]
MKTILLFVVCLFFSCKKEQKNNSELEKNNLDKCFNRIEKINLINEILKTENIQTYLHLDIEERNPVRIIKNDFFFELDSFLIDNYRYVKIVDSLPYNKLKLQLEINPTDSCQFSRGNFIFYSPIENAEVNGDIELKDSVWTISVIRDIEF